MKSTKNLVCLLLSAVMVLGLFSACGGQGEETQPTADTTEATEVPTTVPESTATEPTETEPAVLEVYYDFYVMNRPGFWASSTIKDYPSVTGAPCTARAKDFFFLYDESQLYMVDDSGRYIADAPLDLPVYLYEYDSSQLNAYVAYLEQSGYVNAYTFCDGHINYYTTGGLGNTIKIVVAADETYVAICPYMSDSVTTTPPYYFDGKFALTHQDLAKLLETRLAEQDMHLTLSYVDSGDAGQAVYHFLDSQTGAETEFYLGMECDPDTECVLNNVMVYSVLGGNPDMVLQLAAACSAILDPAIDEQTIFSIPAMEPEYDDGFNVQVNYTAGSLTYTWLSQPYYLIAFNITVAETP